MLKTYNRFLTENDSEKIPTFDKQFESGIKYFEGYNRDLLLTRLLKDALKKGELFNSDVSESAGQLYPKSKKDVLKLVPQGGYWRDLQLAIQKNYCFPWVSSL